MNELQQWLFDRGIDNPHNIPNELKQEYKDFIGNNVVFFPQPGGQQMFHDCPADIVLYGGEAGGGKSFSITYEHVKWIYIKNYEGIIARKNFSQIFDAGGLWQEACRIYPHFGGVGIRGERPMFRFPSGARVVFKHSNYEADVERIWKGVQSPLITPDEITEFSKREFLYMMSRNRSMTGIRPYIRATCNPDPNSFVREMIDWWIGPDGLAIDERCGVIRYFVHRGGKFVWADTKEELEKKFGEKCLPKSFTFIRGRLSENKMMGEMVGEGQYEASLENLDEGDRHALSGGNWDHLENPKAFFNKKNINDNRIEYKPLEELEKVVIGVDPAGATDLSNDETGIVVCGKGIDGRGYTLADETGRYQPEEWAKIVCDLFSTWKADKIIAEKNFGGDMVRATIMAHNENIIPTLTNSSKGTTARAQPISTLYSRNKICHVGHGLTRLEGEMCNWDPNKKKSEQKSPNRMDAMVFAHNELFPLDKPKRVARIWGMNPGEET